MTTTPGFETVDEAWIAWVTRVLPALAASEYHPTSLPDDAALAAFVRAHPGELEAKLLSHLDIMARQGRGDRHKRNHLSLVYGEAGSPAMSKGLIQTFEAMAPELGFDLFLTIASRYRREIHRYDREALKASILWFRSRDVPLERLDRFELCPELRDAIHPRGHDDNDILPADLNGMTVEDIQLAFEVYMGMPIADIEARLRPGAVSDTGFLAPEDRLAEVVFRDAAALRAIGVDRHALAAATAEILDDMRRRRPPNFGRREVVRERLHERRGEAPSAAEVDAATALELAAGHDKWPRPYYLAEDDIIEVSEVGYMGLQDDPFHLLPLCRGECTVDFTFVRKRGGRADSAGSGGIIVALIRRACFFEGKVPHRVDPAALARAVGLVP